jgi:hypothetical protein
LVGQEKQIEATQNLPDVRFLDVRFLDVRFLDIRFLFLSLLPMPPLKHDYSAISAIAQ